MDAGSAALFAVVGFIITLLVVGIVLFIYTSSINTTAQSLSEQIQAGVGSVGSVATQIVTRVGATLGAVIDFMHTIWGDMNRIMQSLVVAFQQTLNTAGDVILDYLAFLISFVNHRVDFIRENSQRFFTQVVNPVLDTINLVVSALIKILVDILDVFDVSTCPF